MEIVVIGAIIFLFLITWGLIYYVGFKENKAMKALETELHKQSVKQIETSQLLTSNVNTTTGLKLNKQDIENSLHNYDKQIKLYHGALTTALEKFDEQMNKEISKYHERLLKMEFENIEFQRSMVATALLGRIEVNTSPMPEIKPQEVKSQKSKSRGRKSS